MANGIWDPYADKPPKPGIHSPDPDGNHTPEGAVSPGSIPVSPGHEFVLKDEQEALAEKVAGYSQEFDEVCQARHNMGEEKYGPGKFLNVDTMDEALQEVADLANYARYTYVKVRLLQDRIQAEEVAHEQGVHSS